MNNIIKLKDTLTHTDRRLINATVKRKARYLYTKSSTYKVDNYIINIYKQV